jgi:hypothetical protein
VFEFIFIHPTWIFISSVCRVNVVQLRTVT